MKFPKVNLSPVVTHASLLMNVVCIIGVLSYALLSSSTPEPKEDVMAPTVEEKVLNIKYVPLTNDEIITETKKCMDAGLNAESFDMPARYGKGTIVHIGCVIRQ